MKRNFRKRKTVGDMVMDIERSSSSSSSSKKRKQDGGGGGGANCVHPIAKGDHSTDAEGGIRRFHWMRTEWGFDELVLLNTLNDACNGYLFEDCCVFGAEVFVIKHSGKGECISMMKDPLKGTYTWKIDKFSEIVNENVLSEEFVVGGHKWKLCLYPKGNVTSEGKVLSVFLQLADSENLPSEWKLYAEYKLRIKNQVNVKHFERGVVTHWFSASGQSFGYPNFM